jgi:SAM-dependent methyltransferase
MGARMVDFSTAETQSVEQIDGGGSVSIIEGFESYAPELIQNSPGFESGFFADLFRLETTNFWFRSRNKIIISALKKFAPNFDSLLEIGCGTGYVLKGIRENFPQANLFGSEIFTEGLKYAATRLPNTKLMQMDARAIPFTEKFDVIGAFDVLEHVKEDNLVLAEIHKALKPRGIVLITVPQHQWLWSAADEYAHHERRYSKSELHEKVERAGFKILRSTSFVSLLLPAMFISRLRRKKQDEKFDPSAEFKISPLLNRIFEFILTIEYWGIKLGLNYPVGGSRLLIAQKI